MLCQHLFLATKSDPRYGDEHHRSHDNDQAHCEPCEGYKFDLDNQQLINGGLCVHAETFGHWRQSRAGIAVGEYGVCRVK